MGEYNNYQVKTLSNNYSDNHARFGNIVYSISRKTIDSLNLGGLNINDAVTVPSRFEKDIYSYDDDISILSGETIPENIACN